MVTGLYFWACVAGALSALVVFAVCAVLRERTKREFRAYVAALEQASDFTGNGLMFFDENERLRHANSRVYDFLPEIDGLKDSGVISLHAVLDYFYDHGVDCDQSLLNTLGRSAEKLSSIGFREVTFSRHEIVHSGAVDLGELVREQEGLLRPLLDASIQCAVRVGDEAMWVECSPEKITQILMNLAVNSRDAMERGGRLLIECGVCPEEAFPEILQRKEGDKGVYAFLKVEDTGTGMEKEVVERIFDPFFTTKEQGKGTGLGLSMVYGLVKQAGGVIDVESVLGEGTSITVYLPLTDKPPKRLSGSAETPDSIRFDGYTALVAEDEPDLLLLVSSALEELGMEVLSACDGREALVLQDEYEGVIDLLLTDVVMPELNGVDLAEFVQEFRPETHVIFMSGYPDKGQVARVSIPENAVFAAKPIRHDDLAGLVYSKLKGGGGDSGRDCRAPHWASKQDDDNDKELL